MAKGNIIVVEACSTGYNYIEDIIKRGYEPIVLETRLGDPETEQFFADYREMCYSLFPRKVKILPAGETYEDDLKAVKAFNPVLVLAGEEHGVELATHLADDLGLPGNAYKNIDKYIKKSEMHRALLEHGVRGIRGKLTSSLEEAEAFVKELGHEHVVVKPAVGCGSQGLKLCASLEEMREGFQKLLGNSNYFGEEVREVLVQERIYGKEYIVNTISRNGKHKITTMWSYEKVQTEAGGYVYDKIETVNTLKAEHTELVEYVYRVLNALDIKDGPVHGEYMIDKTGPVLIEINCRPLGLAMPAEYLDLLSGQHETDTFLDAMLNNDTFEKHLYEPYHMLRKGIVKLLIAPKDVDVEAQPVRILLEHMRSVYTVRIKEQRDLYHIKKSEDMEGNAGIIFMVHDNPDFVKEEAEFLHKLEEQFFRMLYHGAGKKQTPLKKDCLGLKEVMKMTRCEGTTLIISNQPQAKELDAVAVTVEELEDSMKGFDQVIVDFPSYGDKHEVETTVANIFKAMDKVKNGGRLIVPESFYQKLPYGRRMIESLMIIGGLTIELPSFDVHDVVCARKGTGVGD